MSVNSGLPTYGGIDGLYDGERIEEEGGVEDASSY